MIKVALKNHRHFYDVLQYGRVRDSDDFDENAVLHDTPVVQTKHNCIRDAQTTNVELPEPLKNVYYCFNRIGTLYGAKAIITPRDNDAVKGISPFFSQLVDKNGRVFFPTTKDGTGYITSLSLEVLMSIYEDDCHSSIRAISLGEGGSKSRLFGDFKEFSLDINLLNKYVNLFLEACYTCNAARKRGNVIPELTLEAN